MNKYEKHNVIPSIDIIPLQSSSGVKRKFNQMDSNRFRDQEGSNRNYRDEQILARVQNYLFENEDKVFIDVNDMADHLQRKYREYRNRKRNQFRIMVRKAYDEITESVTKKSNANWHDEEEEEVDIESDPDEDLVSTDLLKMYKKPGEKRNGNSSDKELIDISSDDDSLKNDEVPTKRMRTDSVIAIGNKPQKKFPQNDSILEPEIQMTTIPDERPVQEKAPEKSVKKRKEKEVEKYFVNKKQEFTATVPEVKFTNVGGNTKALMNVCKSLLHVKNPQLCSHFGKSPPRGILLCGPPGCGKSLVAQAIAGELQMPLVKVAAPELIGGISGESESRIRDLFDQAVALAPCVLFLDEIDAIAPPKATAQKEMEKRIVSQLLLSLDGLESKENESKVLIIGATSRPEALDPALRGPGRFDQEICLGIPDKDARAAILKVHTENMKLSKDIDLTKLAALTPGYVGADLVALITQAAMAAINRAFKIIKQKPAENTSASEKSQVPKESAAKDDKPNDKPIDVDISQDDVLITEPEVEIEKEKKKESAETTESEKPKEDKPEESKKGDKEAPKDSEKDTQKEAEKTEKPAESSTPDDNNDDAVIIDEVTIEESTSADLTTEKVDVISDEPIIEEPDDSPSTKTAEPPKPECDVEIEELTEMVSWLHGEVKVTDEQLQKLCIEQEDFDNALEVVQPSAKREGFATVPDVTWNDVGSLQNIRDELYLSIIAPVKHFEQFKSLGLSCSTGVLLCGPPGCGKTLLAKAIANEAEINFISVKGPELLNMYVGESEKAVRQCFMRARNSSPCVIFFDEIDALCPKRSDGDASATSRVVNQMLTEMDGIDGRQGVFLMAASNRPDIIDPAVLRPGRLDKILYVGLPNASDRREILNALTKNGTRPKFSGEVKLDEISSDVRCEGYTGADLAALVREAGVQALREFMSSPNKEAEICARHINAALNKIKPSVREEDMEYYLKLKDKYSVDYISNQDVPMDTPENITPGTPCVEAMET